MGALVRVKIRWAGFIGSPGYSVMHFLGDVGTPTGQETAEGAASLAATWCQSIKDLLPAVASLQVMGDVEEIAESTGELVNIYSVTTPGPTSSSAASGESYAGPCGAVVNWRTSGVRNGRRVHGKTFLVPLTSSALENNGTLKPTTMSTILSASNTLINGAFDAPDFGVFARPTSPGNTDGIFHAAKSCNVPDMAAVLRSRRD